MLAKPDIGPPGSHNLKFQKGVVSGPAKRPTLCPDPDLVALRFDELNGRCIQRSRDFKQGDDCRIAATIFQSADVLLTEA